MQGVVMRENGGRLVKGVMGGGRGEMGWGGAGGGERELRGVEMRENERRLVRGVMREREMGGGGELW